MEIRTITLNESFSHKLTNENTSLAFKRSCTIKYFKTSLNVAIGKQALEITLIDRTLALISPVLLEAHTRSVYN